MSSLQLGHRSVRCQMSDRLTSMEAEDERMRYRVIVRFGDVEQEFTARREGARDMARARGQGERGLCVGVGRDASDDDGEQEEETCDHVRWW